jgi:hypothetical protein
MSSKDIPSGQRIIQPLTEKQLLAPQGAGYYETVWPSEQEHNGVYKVSASPAIVPDRDLLYIDDYQNGTDSLVVLRLSSGEKLAAVPLAANLPTIGTIFLGMNEDVYILSSEAGGDKGLISRIFVR